jgi:hypothetical protein
LVNPAAPMIETVHVQPASDRLSGPLPDHLRPVDETPVHTDDLPALPTRDRRIPATAWIEAPDRLLRLGDDIGHELSTYKRRIGNWFLWRAGPATDSDARYLAIDAADVTDANRQFEFRLFADGTGTGTGPDGVVYDRFRTWKESLLSASGRPVHRRAATTEPGQTRSDTTRSDTTSVKRNDETT